MSVIERLNAMHEMRNSSAMPLGMRGMRMRIRSSSVRMVWGMLRG